MPVITDSSVFYSHIPGAYTWRAVAQSIGKNIRETREGLGITQDQLAERSGLKQSAISKYEKEKSVPEVLSLLKLAAGFEVPVQRLVDGVEKQYDLTCQKLGLQRMPHPASPGGTVDPATARVLKEQLAERAAFIATVEHAAMQILEAITTEQERITAKSGGAPAPKTSRRRPRRAAS